MASSDEQYGPELPYHPDEMTPLPVTDLLRLIPGPATPAASPASCFEETTLAAAARGALREPIRAAVVAHLAECAVCRRQVASATMLFRDPAIAAELRRLSRPVRSRQPMLASLGLAAAAAVLLFAVVPRQAGDRGAHRGPVLSSTPAPVLIAPVGSVPQPAALTWTRATDIRRYRVTLFDAVGALLFETEVADTSVTLPASLELVPGVPYYWRVEAYTPADRWVESAMVEFRILGPTPQGAVPVPALTRLAVSWNPPPVRIPAPGANPASDARDALRQAFAAALRSGAAGGRAPLEQARRVAEGYRTEWGDDFLVRELNRFLAWSPGQRTLRVQADSLRQVGVAAYGRAGPGAAIAMWREALRRSTLIPDSAGAASVLGNIGAVLVREDLLDSGTVYLWRAHRLAEAVGDQRVSANVLSELAGLSEQWGDPGTAQALYDRAAVVHQRIGDWRGLAADYNNSSSLARAAGDADAARVLLGKALIINRRAGRSEAAATNLVNLAHLEVEVGEFQAAADHYQTALAAWLVRGDSAEAASALGGLGELELRRGDYSGAVWNFEAAVSILDRTGPAADAVIIRQRLAVALAARGMLQEALDQTRLSRRRAIELGLAPEVQAKGLLVEADLATRLNRPLEADRLYGAAAALYDRIGDSGGAAGVRHGLGLLWLRRGDPQLALPLLEAALRTQLAIGDARSAAITRLALGRASATLGDTLGAQRQFSLAGADLTRLGDRVAAAAVLQERAHLEAEAGRPAAAEALYRDALARLQELPATDLRWQIHAGLAEVLSRQDDRAGAANALRQSIADLEAVGASVRLPERRADLLADKWGPYQRLARLEFDRGRIAASFAASEAMRARGLLELLGSGRIAAPRDTAALLIGREQDLRRQIGILSRALEDAPDGRLVRGPDVSRLEASVRGRLLRAQAEYADLRLEIREQTPGPVSLRASSAITWRMVARHLRPDEAMLEYFVGDSGSLVYAITRDTLVGIPLAVSRRSLARRVSFVRAALESPDRVVDAAWRAPLEQLHRELITPIEETGILVGRSRLTIIPHAELHYLPFAALVERAAPLRYLVERYELRVAPSASAWLALTQTPRTRGAGVLALAPHPEQLPASARELAAVARYAGSGGRILSGREATESALAREAAGRRVIHLATYGVLNKQNPLFSFIDLSGDGSRDGRLETHEVFGLDLSADLVVLAACQTAVESGSLEDVPAGEDWVGLTRAFLSAGARSVMASLWAVQDRATADLMEQFYRRLDQGSDPVRPLAEAQRALLRSPGTDHPFYWAGFVVVGGGTGR